jgi:hypothetical protein
MQVASLPAEHRHQQQSHRDQSGEAGQNPRHEHRSDHELGRAEKDHPGIEQIEVLLSGRPVPLFAIVVCIVVVRAETAVSDLYFVDSVEEAEICKPMGFKNIDIFNRTLVNKNHSPFYDVVILRLCERRSTNEPASTFVLRQDSRICFCRHNEMTGNVIACGRGARFNSGTVSDCDVVCRGKSVIFNSVLGLKLLISGKLCDVAWGESEISAKLPLGSILTNSISLPRGIGRPSNSFKGAKSDNSARYSGTHSESGEKQRE